MLVLAIVIDGLEPGIHASDLSFVVSVGGSGYHLGGGAIFSVFAA